MLAENGFYIIDFIVIAYLIKKMAGGPLKNFLENRKNITKELDEAKRLHKEASERLTEYRASSTNSRPSEIELRWIQGRCERKRSNHEELA